MINYWADSINVFPNVDIKGGIAVTYFDSDADFGEIGTYSLYDELIAIKEKVVSKTGFASLQSIMYLQNRFNLSALLSDFPECAENISSNGKEKRIVSSSFEKITAFHEDKVSEEDIGIWGIVDSNNRQLRWINRKYVEDNGNFKLWKVILPKSNGSGAIGEILSTPLIGEPLIGEPLIGEPLIGYTQSFIAVGAFDIKNDAVNCLKYVKTKFARALLGVLKITQDNPPEKWKYVPLQDFTRTSDIDWSKPVADIDLQLYSKYGLTNDEIRFIEEKIQPMK